MEKRLGGKTFNPPAEGLCAEPDSDSSCYENTGILSRKSAELKQATQLSSMMHNLRKCLTVRLLVAALNSVGASFN